MPQPLFVLFSPLLTRQQITDLYKLFYLAGRKMKQTKKKSLIYKTQNMRENLFALEK